MDQNQDGRDLQDEAFEQTIPPPNQPTVIPGPDPGSRKATIVVLGTWQDQRLVPCEILRRSAG